MEPVAKDIGPLKMRSRAIQFLRDDNGQDLIEYTLLMAFVALASAAVMASVGSPVPRIWSSVNYQLALASSASSS